MNFSIADDEGVRLAELDTSGPAPTRLVLAGPDKVTVREGAVLDIDVAGDPAAVDALRFNLKDGALAIMRANRSKAKGTARVTVTMPATREIVLAGSGDIEASTLSGDAGVDIAGSGRVAIGRVAAQKLDVNVMGSGTLAATGSADRLDLNVAGSGTLAGRGLKVERAEVNIAGSGTGEFASDGKVEASIAGSGDVVVHGRASCTINAVGSGTLRCRDDGPAAATAAR
ncbi:head GIN domain-containing protein [Qipengyuania sediminis]|uniref:head GIN domain-containing protein n=1 Tax=Qipengyuania sediminis TaxID=1532023 RepID=UPI001F0E3C56|nr:head GIN domain-containing protein [Qipengyuania sediminis]